MGLLHNEWKEQEFNALRLDYQRVIERARINQNILLREEKKIQKLEKQKLRDEKRIQKLEKQKLREEKRVERANTIIITNCSKSLPEEYTPFINAYFKNPYKLFKRPVFLFIQRVFKNI